MWLIALLCFNLDCQMAAGWVGAVVTRQAVGGGHTEEASHCSLHDNLWAVQMLSTSPSVKRVIKLGWQRRAWRDAPCAEAI